MAAVGTSEIGRLEARFREVINPVASLGFLGLATDRASLPDFRAFVDLYPGVAVHATRIPFAPVATVETLRALEAHLQAGTEVLVPGAPLSTISFSCTSGTIAIGVDAVEATIRSVRPESAVATPITATVAALHAFGARRISLLMPYLPEPAAMVASYLESNGFELDASATFALGGDPEINRVDPDCIAEAAVELCHPDSDALFISCTGWLTHPVIERLEAQLGKPVVTSNQALAWQALRGAGVTDRVTGGGRLFAEH